MSIDNSLNGTNSTTVSNSPFLKTIVQQIRGQDTYGVYRNWSDDLILKPYVVTKQKKREISIEGEVDPITQARILAFYRAVAACIEQETGLISQVVVDLNHEGFGWVLVFSGRLLLVTRTLRDAHRFGFDSLEKVAQEGANLIEKGIDLVKRFPEVGKL
ncbi:MAG: NifX-associated nitrogen fixation protein [Aulosira sp. DedQUE10]|nr:NifX-associated nitrogen fixation protein [Aulosira sp. DedQUE10]